MAIESTSGVRSGPRAVAVVWALIAVGLASGCGTSEDPGGITTSEIQQPQYFHEGDYLGQRVTVDAEVTEVLGPRNFQLQARAYGDDSLLVQTSMPVQVRPGQTVRVTGTVGQYHIQADSETGYMQNDRYEKYETEAYIHTATVQPA